MSNTTDTVIFMYYGNSSAGSQQNPSGVWDANYQLVYHMSDNAASTTVRDSTNLLNGSAQANTNAKQTPGKIGGALTFNGSSDYILASSSKAPLDKVTFEIWFKPSASGACRAFGLGGLETRLELNSTSGGAIRFYRTWSAITAWLSSSSSLTPSGSWTHVVLAYDDSATGNAPTLYINGAAQAFGSASPSGSPNDTAGTWEVGAANGTGLCNGALDEARISNAVRSASWIATEYNNQSSPGAFFSMGGDETSSGSGGGNYVTSYSYDILGHLTGVSMTRATGSGNVTQTRSFNYSGNLLMSATNPENGTVSYSYNSYRKVATRTDAKGQVVVYSYDTYARLIKVQRYPQGTGNAEDTCQQENYYYDSNPFDSSYSQYVLGRLAAVQYNACNSRTFIEMYSYSPAGGVVGKRLRVSQTQNWYSDYNPSPTTMNVDLNAGFGYDNEGRMTSEQYPLSGPNMALGYDSMGRPYSAQDQNAGNAGVPGASYGPAGQLQSMSGGGGFAGQSFSYNAMLQLTGISTIGMNLQYSYSPNQNNGKVVSQTDLVSGETVSYTYDALNRLATAVSNSSSAPWGQAFTYDGFGNLTNVNVISGSAPIQSATYDPATNHGYCSDANGNGMSGVACAFTPATYFYDVENRVTTSLPSGSAVMANASYAYAPGNKRVWRGAGTYNSSTGLWSTDEVTFWAPSGQKLATYQLTAMLGCYYASQQCGNGFPPQFYASQTGTYYYFGGRMVKNAQGWVYPDRLGSIGKFYPYGTERPSATTNGTEKFTGYLRDAETGNDYADQRYESPGMGRFLTVDRMTGQPNDPGSWNRYAYVGGDPINRNDPSGREYCDANGYCVDDSVCESDPDPLDYDAFLDFCNGGATYVDPQSTQVISTTTGYGCAAAFLTYFPDEGQCDFALNDNAQSVFAQVNAMNPGGLINAAGLTMATAMLGPGGATLALGFTGEVTLLGGTYGGVNWATLGGIVSANVLKIPQAVWDEMGQAAQESAMIELLTNAIDNKDIIVFASDPKLALSGSGAAFEWQYLDKLGYQLFEQPQGAFIAAKP